LEGRPLKFGRAKKVQNSARFLTTFDFDREYLRNDSTYPKSERTVIDSDSSRVPRKKSCELRSTNKKDLLARTEPPKWIFWGDYISAPRGCCALKFINALDIAQALIAHTRSGMGVPSKKFNRENLKFALKFSVLATITSGQVGVSPQNIFHTTCRGTGVIIWVSLLEGRPPKIWEGPKNLQNSARFLTTFEFDREYLRNISRYPKSERNVIDSDSSRVPRKKSGELWSTNKKVLLARIEPPK